MPQPFESLRAAAVVDRTPAPPRIRVPQGWLASPRIDGDTLRRIPEPRVVGRTFVRPAGATAPLRTAPTSTLRGLRRAFAEQKLTGPNGSIVERLTAFDLLLPVLQPPITIDAARAQDLPHPLHRYQVEGIRFLMESDAALLADEMGTGKTVMSCVALRMRIRSGAIRRALVVVPLNVLRVWDRHLAEWAPELSVTVVHGDQRTRFVAWRAPAHVYLTTYDTLRSDVEGEDPLLAGVEFDLVLLDEAQCVKNESSGRARAVRAFRPSQRWALSGTPVENRLGDLVALFSFLKPGLLDAEAMTPAEAREWIAPHVKRRTKAEVMSELPPKIRQEEWLELDADQERAYREAEREARATVTRLGSRVTRMHVFTLLTRLKRICNFAPGSIDSPKLRVVRDKIEAIRDGGKKALVFSQWLGEGVDKVAGALAPFGVVRYDARLSEPERLAAVDRFRADPSVTAFVATVKSAGVGLTLTEASYVIHFDHWWNPAWMWQAEDRAHRRGQSEPVNVYSLWMAGTVEERVHKLLEQKGLLHAEIVDGLSESAADELISVADWIDVLGV